LVTNKTSQTAQRWKVGMEQLTLRDLIGYWEFHNRTENKSADTIRWYNEALGTFEKYLVGAGLSTLIADIGEPEVRGFIAQMQDQHCWEGIEGRESGRLLAAESIQTRLRALKAFFAWLHREQYTERHRLERLPNYKTPKQVVEVLTEGEIQQLLRACNPKTAWGARAHAIVTLALDSGLRRSEIVGLRTADLNLDAGWLKVLGKGGKERIVPFGTATQRDLWRYAHHYRAQPLGPDVYFFLTRDGTRMTGGGLASLFNRLRTRSGVTRLHPHLCRHTFATRYLMNGGDVFSLQQILGHTSLEMVRRYVNLASAHVAVQHRKYSPMDQIAGGMRGT